MSLSLTGDPARPFVLGDAPFWPVDHLARPDAGAGHIPFAFWIVHALRPRLLVELGHPGNSYLAFAQAVQRLGLGTACFAVDTRRGDDQAGSSCEEVFHELCRYHDSRYSAFSRLVRSTLDEAAAHFPDGSIDLLHLEGGHTYEAVTHDFATWRPKLSSHAVVLVHDINVRERDAGAWRLWSELCTAYPHFEFLHAQGLGVLGIGPDLPASVTALWPSPPDPTRVTRIRDAFARLGSAVVERLQLGARVEAAQSELAQLGEVVRAAGREVAARDESLRKAAEDRAALEEAFRVRDQARVREIDESLALIAGLQHEIVRLGKVLEADRQAVAGLREHVLRLERDRAETNSAEAALRADLAGLYRSKSWRLTRPLRQAAGWYRAAAAWARSGARTR